MRKLQTEDMFLLSEIIDKMDLKIDIKDKTQAEAGLELVLQLVKKAYKTKEEIKQLVSTLTGKTIEEVSAMSPKEMISTISEIMKQDGVLDFFK
jgi:enoyl-[acyl-carrier-protein] reductase (NADH)